MELFLNDFVNARSIVLFLLDQLVGNVPNDIRGRKLVNSDSRDVGYLVNIKRSVQKLFF
jgi:hypothetical protein